jgi:hypothetical protein
MKSLPPKGYEAKYADFIRMCGQAKKDNTPLVLVDCAHVLGDDYDEIIESLNRLADAGLKLAIARRNPD